MLIKLNWTSCLLVWILACNLDETNAAEQLGQYNVDALTMTVSGISSGAAMATQFHFAHSSQIHGCGLFAGVPYMCGYGGVGMATSCMTFPSMVNVNVLILEATNRDNLGLIDSTSNLKDDRVFIFHGRKDSTVYPASGDSIVEMYTHYEANIKTEFTYEAEHGQPTDDYGAACGSKSGKFEYINNCNYKGAFEMLNHLYGGSLTRPNPSTVASGDLVEFDQSEFFYISPPSVSSMGTIGYIYIPSGCRDRSKQCRFHIAFHGCHQNKASIGDVFARKTGYLEAAELNNIIVLFPQTIATPVNPNACWDWWGYLNIYFPTKEGNQVLAVWRMLERVVLGSRQ